MKTFKAGDWVEYRSLSDASKLFTGQVLGFYGEGTMAICTDQTGLNPRPVSIGRLAPAIRTYQHTGGSAA